MCRLASVAARSWAFDLPKFLAAGDLASYLGVSPHGEPPLTLPTELHVLFIGFNGEAAGGAAELLDQRLAHGG